MVDIRRKQKCAAKSSRTGEPCQRWAMNGTNVCQMHGGAARQVRLKARERLNEMANRAIDTLDIAMEKIDTDSAVAVKAAVAVLDRTGYHSKRTIEIQDPDEVLARVLGVSKEELPD